jgi:hypothetical protein
MLIALDVDVNSRCKEVEELLKLEKYQRLEKETEYEKRIRLLEQDVYILQYGYEGAENESKN